MQKYGGATIGKDKIMYGSSLSEYLKSSGFNNSQAYENAISPLFIKKCPYDPYELHGSTSDFVNLKIVLIMVFIMKVMTGHVFSVD